MSFDPKDGGVPVYISRYGAKLGQGHMISWSIGEKATYVGRTGLRHPVTIASYFVKSADPKAGNDLCLEVTFDNEHGARYCVPAKGLEPVGGFPPFVP